MRSVLRKPLNWERDRLPATREALDPAQSQLRSGDWEFPLPRAAPGRSRAERSGAGTGARAAVPEPGAGEEGPARTGRSAEPPPGLPWGMAHPWVPVQGAGFPPTTFLPAGRSGAARGRAAPSAAGATTYRGTPGQARRRRGCPRCGGR